MKKIVLISIVGLFAISVFAQDSNTGLARVKKVSGIEVYVYSEPVRQYEVVGEVSGENVSSVLNAISAAVTEKASDVKCYEIDERIKIFVNNALKKRKNKKNPVDFDAIIVEDHKKAILIKFTDSKSE